jgi:Ca-activated chloride channel family protein
MTLRLLISLSLLFLAWQAACAQSADDFFNGGAQCYISNNLANAWEKVESGRKLYPGDVKLKKLEELLKQQSQQQQSQQNQQSQQQQSHQQPEQKKEQSQQQNSGGQPNQSGQQNQQPNQQAQNQAGQQNKQPPPQPPSQASAGQPQNKQGQNGNEEQTTVMNGQEMTPEEAQRLLDAQKGNEQFLQLKPEGKPENQNRPIKDW